MNIFPAGASSMWASCCGLLNEVMGTGAVRTQQPGFGAGAGPFRFAPSAGCSTYPPSSATSGSTGLVCKACGLAFSVFRRKHVCSDCKKSFCSLCSVLQENLRRCATCHLVWGTAFQRPLLMRLRVKDLRQYLTLRNINTDTCREKEDLVDLVLCHLGAELEIGDDDDEEDEAEELEADTDSLPTLPHSLSSPPASAACSTSQQSTSQQSALPATVSQGEALSRSNSSGTTSQDHGDAASIALLNLEPHEEIMEASPATQRRARASLSDLSQEDDIESLTIRQLKEILARNFVNYSGCCEKWELVERVHRLYRENEHNRRSMENVSNVSAENLLCKHGMQVAQLGGVDENLCRICMDAVIDCVLLECGHMVTCTKCGKRMNECPICRQYVVRAVHVFKS
ncbi:E3 ubiquitin-protein ligase RNF34-like isoform X3 [Xyrauchen texanus]|uniref:E3 ubiquitin-protein ligase RNF34-like isoform X3 n=1 Tax=Xyrauchen texanus TaxID=154827 RepID=UPI002241B07F|nr:E3 ubiquitin-protein ligase RNF34-like isoform X3 [Xyrauchen texanus]